jgi:hypothetical protein
MRVAAALALLLAALALAACGSDRSDTATVQNTVTSSFRFPSGNLGCVMGSGSVRCDVGERDWSPPPPPASCTVDYGQGAEVSSRGRGHLVCAGDTTLNPSAPVLAYGHSIERGGLRCISSEAGMTCTNTATGHGFVISRQSYRLF